MKAVNAVLTLAVFVLAATASAPALAWHHGGHSSFGVFIGGPGYWYPPYYYPPYYPPYSYYPPLVIEQSPPPVYIEQGDAATQAAPPQSPSQPQSATPSQSDWWYYCTEAKAYYPYAKECPGGWQRVAPQPQR